MNVLEKLISAVISALLFSLGFSFFNGSMEYFGIYLMFSSLIFLFGGVLFSMFADLLLKKINFNKQFAKYIGSIILYSIGGIIVNVFLYIVILNEGLGTEAFYWMVYGIAASLIFLHVMFITRKLLNILV